MINELKGVSLIPVDRPTEEGFYIALLLNDGIPESEHSSIIYIHKDGFIKELPTNRYRITKLCFSRFYWIHIRFPKSQISPPTESGMYWVWREGCMADKMIVYYSSEGRYYQTVGESASYSVVAIQNYNWQQVSEPSVS